MIYPGSPSCHSCESRNPDTVSTRNGNQIKELDSRFHGNDVTKADREYSLVLSDWIDEDPHEVMRTLKRGSDYYMLKRGTMQSIYDAYKKGALTDVFRRSLDRMPPMDISDVGFDLFLINGQKGLTLPAKPGEEVLLRIINAAAGTYFYLQFADGSMTVVSADGQDVEPVDFNRILIGIAETYDVIVTVSDKGSFEFRATAQDGSESTSAFIGEGKQVFAPERTGTGRSTAISLIT